MGERSVLRQDFAKRWVSPPLAVAAALAAVAAALAAVAAALAAVAAALAAVAAGVSRRRRAPQRSWAVRVR
jgi:hypothetical protein